MTARSRPPARVLYVAASQKIGGGARVLMELMRRLDRSRYEPAILAPGPGPFSDWAATTGIPCATSRWDGREGRASTWIGAAALAARMAWTRTAIVHTAAQTCFRAAGLAGALVGVKRVCHLGFPPAPGELDFYLESGPDAVIGCYEGQAREVAETMRRIAPRCRLAGIPNGIDVRRFASAAATPADAAAERERWRFGARRVVLIVGHLSRVKGYPAFLRAAARIAGGGAGALEDCAFVALGGETIDVGQGAELERLTAALGIRDRVHFLGFRDDVPAILRAADVMVLPSLDEGLPLAILEAMACARPVVATPVGGVPEAVVDGETGILVPPDDPEALASAIRRLLEDEALARRMGDAGRRRVEERFSLERFVERVQELYDELLASSS